MECIYCKGRMVRGTAPFSLDRKGYMCPGMRCLPGSVHNAASPISKRERSS